MTFDRPAHEIHRERINKLIREINRSIWTIRIVSPAVTLFAVWLLWDISREQNGPVKYFFLAWNVLSFAYNANYAYRAWFEAKLRQPV